MDDPRASFMSDSHAAEVESLSQGHLSMARAAWLQRDFDTARMAYQKAAYVSRRLRDDDVQNALKRELAAFSRGDPLYVAILPEIRAVVERRPGVKQTELYGLVGHDQATVAYVLYFASENLDLHRKKAGRTYQVFPPGHTIEG